MVTLPTINATHYMASLFVVGYITTRGATPAMTNQLAHGASPEKVLQEWAHATKGTSEGEGFSYLLKAIAALRQEDAQRALEELRRVQAHFPDLGPFLILLEGAALTLLKEYNKAFDAYKGSVLDLQRATNQHPEAFNALEPILKEVVKDLYQRWALVGVIQGLEGLISGNSDELELGLRKVHQVVNESKSAGQGNAPWEVLEMVARALDDELQPQMDVFRTCIRMISDERAGPGWIEHLAKIYSTVPGPALGTPARQVAEGLKGLSWPDPDFARDLEAVIASQPELQNSGWPD